ASLARFGLRDEKVPQRDRKRRGQQHVRGRCASECEPTDRRGKYQRGNETCSAIPQPAATPINKKHGYGRSEGRRESRAGFIDSEEFVTERGQPVHERRLFKPRHSVEARRDIVAAQQHLAGNCCVTWFVGPDESNAAEAIKEKNVRQNGEHSDHHVVVITAQRGFHVIWTALLTPKKYAKISRMSGGIKGLLEYT